jgi:hypothetical protein
MKPNATSFKSQGKSTENELLRKSAEMRVWRRHVFTRDDYTCQACGQRGGKLHADHELPFSLFPDLRFEILNGRTLCEECHKQTPSFFKNIYQLRATYFGNSSLNYTA